MDTAAQNQFSAPMHSEAVQPSAAPAAAASTPAGPITVTFVEDGKTFDASGNVTVRKVARANGVKILIGTAAWANCFGNGLCGTCRVSVDPAAAVAPPTFLERFTLGKDCGKLRLACQTKVTSAVNVKLKPAHDYSEIHHNVVFQGALIGAFSLIMLGFVAMLFFDIAGKAF